MMVEHDFDGHEFISDTRDQVRAVCECGWRSEPVPVTTVGFVTDDVDDALDEQWLEHVRPLVDPDPSQVLILVDDRHHLAGEPLHNGTSLELLLPDGTWWAGRYETTRRDGELIPLFFVLPDGTWWADRYETTRRDGELIPLFFARIGGPAADNDAPGFIPQVNFEIPARAVLRFPERR